jgi:DNA-binding MarR family transcriptional regulator
MDNEQKVIDAFQKARDKELSAKEAAELSGVDKKDVDKIIKKLKKLINWTHPNAVTIKSNS